MLEAKAHDRCSQAVTRHFEPSVDLHYFSSSEGAVRLLVDLLGRQIATVLARHSPDCVPRLCWMCLLRQVQQRVLVARQVDHIPRLRQIVGDLLGRFDSSQFDQRLTGITECFRQQTGRLRVTLGTDDRRLLQLFGLLHHESCLLGVLLRDLLQFDGGGEFTSKRQVGLGGSKV